MKLLGTDSSPFTRKVRIAILEKRIPFEYVIASPGAPDTIVPRFNPLGKVPVLVLDDGSALYDSNVIVEYIDGLAPQPKLIPDAFRERIQVRRWEALGDGVTEAAIAISHDHRKPKEKHESGAWHQRQREKIARGLATMASDLGQREHCHGDGFSLADIAVGYALSYVERRLPDLDWRTSHPNLDRLAERLMKRDSFSKTAITAA